MIALDCGEKQQELYMAPAVFLYTENHSLGEWFKRGLCR